MRRGLGARSVSDAGDCRAARAKAVDLGPRIAAASDGMTSIPPRPSRAPAAIRRRPAWSELPRVVRTAVEDRLGTTVTAATSQDGGYSPGFASVLQTSAGPVFVKASGSAHADTQLLYREEARRHAVLPEGVPAPAFRWQLEVPDVPGSGDWVVSAFDAVPGRVPRVPLDGDELEAVLRLAGRIPEHVVPEGALPAAGAELPTDRWARVADEDAAGLDSYDPWATAHLDLLVELEAGAAAAVAGTSLVHADLRGDNLLLLPGGSRLAAVAVDWAYAARGAAFFDLVALAQAVHAEGGPEPETVLERQPPAGGYRRRRGDRLPRGGRRVLRARLAAAGPVRHPAPACLPARAGRGLHRVAAPPPGDVRCSRLTCDVRPPWADWAHDHRA